MPCWNRTEPCSPCLIVRLDHGESTGWSAYMFFQPPHGISVSYRVWLLPPLGSTWCVWHPGEAITSLELGIECLQRCVCVCVWWRMRSRWVINYRYGMLAKPGTSSSKRSLSTVTMWHSQTRLSTVGVLITQRLIDLWRRPPGERMIPRSEGATSVNCFVSWCIRTNVWGPVGDANANIRRTPYPDRPFIGR